MNGWIDRVLTGLGTDRGLALLWTAPGPAVLSFLARAPEGDVGAFADFLAGSPVPAVLLLAGALITGFSVALVAYLGVGAVLEAFIAQAIE